MLGSRALLLAVRAISERQQQRGGLESDELPAMRSAWEGALAPPIGRHCPQHITPCNQQRCWGGRKRP